MPTTSDEGEDNILFIQFNPDRQDTPPILSMNSSSPSSPSQSSSPSHVSLSASSRTEKPPNPRLLSFLLQALVMALAVSLFFLFVGIAALLLLHICLACRALRRHRSHRPQPPDYGSALPSGLSLKDLQNLPCFDRGAAGPASDCAICLDSFREGDRCRLLPGCNHAFHAVCVDTWLVRVPACPICRAGVTEVIDQETRAS